MKKLNSKNDKWNGKILQMIQLNYFYHFFSMFLRKILQPITMGQHDQNYNTFLFFYNMLTV